MTWLMNGTGKASTQPGDGSEVDTDGHRQRSDTDEVLRKTQKVPFKEQVIGMSSKPLSCKMSEFIRSKV